MSKWATRELPRPHIFVQWKGTDVCADLYCICGKQFHLDCEFMYAVECPFCKRKYEVSAMIEIREITKEEVEIDWKDYDFKTEVIDERSNRD